MTIKLAVFDFDGTLADSADWIISAVGGLAERHRFRAPDREEIERLRSLGTRQIIRSLGISRWRIPAIARDVRARAARDAHEIPVFPGTRAVLETLSRRGLRLAILSSNSEANVRAVLGAETASLISDYACGASLFGKPRLLRRLLRQTALSRLDAIYIGDETRDIEAARAVGVASAGVAWGYAEPALLRSCDPDFFFETMAELLDALDGAGGARRRPVPGDRLVASG